MGLEAENNQDDASARLVAAGRALLAQGDARFSLTKLCAEAGVTLEEFRASFTSKAALLQQLMEEGGAAEQPRAETPVPDPWLERRLRVFERALTSLEEKAERRERELRQTVAQLEEKLAALGTVKYGPVVAVKDRRGSERGGKIAAIAPQTEVPAEQKAPAEQFGPPLRPEEQPVHAESETSAEAAEPQTEAEPNPLLLGPLEQLPPARPDPEFLEAGRRAALAHARALQEKQPRRGLPLRLLLASALAAMVLLALAAATLVRADRATAAPAEATSHREAVLTPLQKLMVRADSGDVRAERTLALAYLRGEGVEKDMNAAARWAEAAAEQGDGQAQTLIGDLTRDGAGVRRDPARAFAWFAKAASAGEVKAMHNLAIAYVEGAGTAKDYQAAASWFARAAARGYVDSAFDLAVMYEKGEGVAQDARAALHWYQAAAQAGDREAASRAQLLKHEAHL